LNEKSKAPNGKVYGRKNSFNTSDDSGKKPRQKSLLTGDIRNSGEFTKALSEAKVTLIKFSPGSQQE